MLAEKIPSFMARRLIVVLSKLRERKRNPFTCGNFFTAFAQQSVCRRETALCFIHAVVWWRVCGVCGVCGVCSAAVNTHVQPNTHQGNCQAVGCSERGPTRYEHMGPQHLISERVCTHSVCPMCQSVDLASESCRTGLRLRVICWAGFVRWLSRRPKGQCSRIVCVGRFVRFWPANELRAARVPFFFFFFAKCRCLEGLHHRHP